VDWFFEKQDGKTTAAHKPVSTACSINEDRMMRQFCSYDELNETWFYNEPE
jgi:hypothetical protein